MFETETLTLFSSEIEVGSHPPPAHHPSSDYAPAFLLVFKIVESLQCILKEKYFNKKSFLTAREVIFHWS